MAGSFTLSRFCLLSSFILFFTTSRLFFLTSSLFFFFNQNLLSPEVTVGQPCEESWRLISRLRKDLPPDKLRTIVKRCGLPSFRNLSKAGSSPDLSRIAATSFPLKSPASSRDSWMTLADIKVQAVKAVCYEVASKGFQQTRNEIEAACIFQLRELCLFYGKRDSNPAQTWRAVARDVMETIGFSGDDDLNQSRQDKEAAKSCESPKVNEISEEVKATLDDVILKVLENEASDRDKSETSTSCPSEIEKIKESMSSLVNMFKGVKLENANKDEEMKMLRKKMEEMERALSGSVEYGKSLLMHDFFTQDLQKGCEENSDSIQKRTVSDSNSVATTSDKGGSLTRNSDSVVSPRYIYSNDFSEPSHGVVVPDWIQTKEDKISWLMENDLAFRRGRLRWEAQQKRHQANLRSQEVNREKRRQQRELKQSSSSRNKPRFSFKNLSFADREQSRSSPKKYFEGPRRKTCSFLTEKESVIDNADVKSSSTKDDRAEAGWNLVSGLKKSSNSTAENLKAPETRSSEQVKSSRKPYYSQRRLTWSNSTCQDPPYRPQQVHQPGGRPFYPTVYENPLKSLSGAMNRTQEWANSPPFNPSWNQWVPCPTVVDASFSPSVHPSITYFNQPTPNFYEEQVPVPAYIESPISFSNSRGPRFYPRSPHPTCQTTPVMFVENSRFFVRPSPPRNITPLELNPPQLYRNPLNDLSPISPTQSSQRESQSPPYMSTSFKSSTPSSSESGQIVEVCETEKKKFVLKGIYQPPFRRKNPAQPTD